MAEELPFGALTVGPPHGLQEINVSRDQPGPGFFRSGRATGAEIKPWVRG